MSLSIRLKTLRQQHKMKQKDVAKAINVSRTTISGYETKDRQPSHEKLNALANLFNVSIDYLLGVTDDDTESSSTPSNVDKQIYALYRDLSYASKEELLNYAKYLKYRENK